MQKLSTIGVSLPVPATVKDVIREIRANAGDPLAHAVPAHITLMPPVQVPQILLPHLQQHLRHVAATTRPFTVRLRGTGTFRPISPVVYAKVVAGIEQCESLQALVRSGPVQRSLDFPYHPHVTIAHGVDESRLNEAQTALENIDETFTVQSLHVSIQGDDGIWRASGAYRFGSLS